MATLKLPKKNGPAGAPRALTTRARDAQQQFHRKPAAKPEPEPKQAKPAFPPKQARQAPPPKHARPAAPPKQARPAAPPKQARPAPPPRPVAPRAPAPEIAEEPRLSKLMGERGLCSRREADEWIENGWVKVDGKVVSTLGVRVPRDARIEIDPAASKHQSEQVTILLNKPVGYVSGQPEDGHEPAMVLIKPENHWAEDPSPTKFRPGHLRGLAATDRR